MEFLNGECWPEHEFFDLPEQINLDVLPEFNLSKIQIGARWFIGQIDKNNLVPWDSSSFGSQEKAIKKAESKRSSGIKWKLWIAPVLVMDFIHRENPEVRFSWMSLPKYLQDVFWLSEIRFMGETLCNGTNSLPLKEASFRLVKRFIIRTNSTTADYIKLTPFEEGTDFFSLETVPLYPIVCDSKSEGARYMLSWEAAIESYFARDYFFDNEIKTNRRLKHFYEAKTQ